LLIYLVLLGRRYETIKIGDGGGIQTHVTSLRSWHPNH
jgi:hypothetical protein